MLSSFLVKLWILSFQDTWIAADEQCGGTLQLFCVVLWMLTISGEDDEPFRLPSCTLRGEKTAECHQHEGESIVTRFLILVCASDPWTCFHCPTCCSQQLRPVHQLYFKWTGKGHFKMDIINKSPWINNPWHWDIVQDADISSFRRWMHDTEIYRLSEDL